MLKAMTRMWKLAGEYHGKLIAGINSLLVESIAKAWPVFGLFIILRHYPDITIRDVWVCVFLSVGGLLLSLGCRYYVSVKVNVLAYDIFGDLRLRIGDRLRRYPMGYFSRQRLGMLTSVLTTSIGDVEAWAMNEFMTIISGGLTALILSVFMLASDWRFGLFSLAVFVCAGVAMSFLDRASANTMVSRQSTQQRLIDTALEFIRGVPVTRAYSTSGLAKKRMQETSAELSEVSMKAETTLIPYTGIYHMIFKTGSLVILLCSAVAAIPGTLELPQALLFGVIALIMYVLLEALNSSIARMEMLSASMDLIDPVAQMDVMETRGEAQSPKGLDIVISDVQLAYDTRTVIDGVSAVIPQGTMCALVGTSGSGKTTLCRLIMRFWDVDSGSITVGGADVRDQEPDELLGLFSVVFQYVYLFSDTVAANIRYGRDDSSDEELREVARRAQCLDFIEQLPDGFDTILAEGGASLSGGERQRISIARALLKDAPIVVLDEATSSVDPENERELQLAIEELCKGKTRLLIADNIGTIVDADQILVFSDGKIVERGTHDELAFAGGMYERFLAARQKSVDWTIQR